MAKRIVQFTEREALELSRAENRFIEIHAPTPLLVTAAKKKVPEGGFLIFDEGTGRLMPASLGEEIPSAVDVVDVTQKEKS